MLLKTPYTTEVGLVKDLGVFVCPQLKMPVSCGYRHKCLDACMYICHLQVQLR